LFSISFNVPVVGSSISLLLTFSFVLTLISLILASYAE